MPFPSRLAGKAALVIGGSEGIGALTAHLFAEAGAEATLTHRPEGQKEAAAADHLGSSPGQELEHARSR
jgi:NAD(P)-dependent dehydrogenase (short-subunit alcohol dehydrogenase family)